MKNLTPSRVATLLGMAFLAFFNSGTSALACAACYGDTTGSKQGIAASWGIFAMVIIMFGMLSAVAAFGFYLRYRAQNPLPDYDELLADHNGHPKPATHPL